jgi:predicted RNase H-like HicB family nuclease
VSNPRDTIRVNVEYSTEDEEYGPLYMATCEEISVITDGKTLDELLANLREAISLQLEAINTVTVFNLVPNPTIVLRVELPYAETA